MTFAGLGKPHHLEVVCQTTTAFWDAYLKGEAKRKEKLLHANAAVEHK